MNDLQAVRIESCSSSPSPHLLKFASMERPSTCCFQPHGGLDFSCCFFPGLVCRRTRPRFLLLSPPRFGPPPPSSAPSLPHATSPLCLLSCVLAFFRMPASTSGRHCQGPDALHRLAPRQCPSARPQLDRFPSAPPSTKGWTKKLATERTGQWHQQ